MEQHVRAASAAVAFAYHRRCDVIGVHELENKTCNEISVAVCGKQVDGYDHDSECQVSGLLPYLYHHGAKSPWILPPGTSEIWIGYEERHIVLLLGENHQRSRSGI
ncbi:MULTISPECIES: hypothetical protein [unclassified Bradyrhizobium]|uniref:hypothetical protein n=1 Tax=Bradyrhizobium sp. USDA 4541 TaxID=2817704 RepID=UPI0020A54588|nr:hypothetical protein [Bradyrhizobium sp. USDA 4541]MCP1846825.1 hypothetical protein [Bradyrhizobium sp. USDA 4541]